MNGVRSSVGNTEKSLSETAAGWLARRQDGMDEREIEAFVEWLSAHPSHKQAYDDLSRSWEALAAMAPIPRVAELRSEALIANPPRGRGILRIVGLAAAAIVGAVGLGSLYNQLSPPAITGQVWDKVPPQQAIGEVLTMMTDRPTITLVDGSTITLNSDARAKVMYTANERRIIMLSGQAFFQVAHDPKRPFIVSAGDREVLAVGTQFDIRVDKERVVVALLEGRVKIRPQRRPQQASKLTTATEAMLEPGERLQFAVADPATIISTVDVEELVRWREGRVRFDATPLRDAVREMNRYSPVEIRISDATLDDIKVSGVFRTGQSDSFVSALSEIFPVRVERTETAIELHSSNAALRKKFPGRLAAKSTNFVLPD